MKSLRIIGSIVYALVFAAVLFAPADVAALVPPSVSDFLLTPEGVTVSMATVSLTNISRLERQKSNLGGVAKIFLIGESDFTGEWPTETEGKTGEVTTAIPLKVGATMAVLTFDIGSARGKSAKKGALGYQNYEHDIEAKMAGYEKTQLASLNKTLNEGGVAILQLKNGTRVVYGTSLMPLVFEDSGDTGAKADDGNSISFKGKSADGVAFAAPTLGTTVVLPLPV